MGTVLCFNLDENVFAKAAALASCCGAEALAVEKSAFSLPLAVVLGGAPDGAADGGDFSEPMMVLCGMDDDDAEAFLGFLREAKLSAGIIKAFLTETNRSWSASALYRELCSERAAFEKLRSGKK